MAARKPKSNSEVFVLLEQSAELYARFLDMNSVDAAISGKRRPPCVPAEPWTYELDKIFRAEKK